MKKTCAVIALATAFSASAAQAAAGDVIVRMRAIVVAPNEGSRTGALQALNAKVNNDVVPEVDFTYMITNNIGAELIAATSMHKIKSGGAQIGKTYVLPPTLSLQYHLAPEAAIRPYVGVGVNYTIFYKTKSSGPIDGSNLDLKDSFGVSGQVGVDIDITKKFFVNLDVKYITMKAKARLNGAGIGKMDLNPLVLGIGFGTRF